MIQKRGKKITIKHKTYILTIKHIKKINLNPCEVSLLLQIIHICV